MKNLYKLIEFEFKNIFKIVLGLAILLITVQNLLLFLSPREYRYGNYISFEKLISTTGVPIVFYICFVLLLACCVFSVVSNYIGSKSIYTLMTIPHSRSYIFISKLVACFINLFVLLAAQFISLFMGYSMFAPALAIVREDSVINYVRPVNGMFLAFIRSDFLRILFPLTIESLISTVVILVSIICGIFFTVYCVQTRNFRYIAIAAVNIILIIFILSYRINPVEESTRENLYIYSCIFIAFSAYYIWQSLRWINKSLTIG